MEPQELCVTEAGLSDVSALTLRNRSQSSLQHGQGDREEPGCTKAPCNTSQGISRHGMSP